MTSSQIDLQQQLEYIHSQIQAIDECSVQRQKKYDNAMKCHIKKESNLIEANIQHSNKRNIMLIQDIHKSSERAFKNVPIVMKIIKQTNREKKNISKLISQTLPNFKQNSINSQNIHESVDLSKYRDILEQYRHKIY